MWFSSVCNNLPEQMSRLEPFCWFSSYSFEALLVHETQNKFCITVLVSPTINNSKPNSQVLGLSTLEVRNQPRHFGQSYWKVLYVGMKPNILSL